MGSNMNIKPIAIDLTKNFFSIFGSGEKLYTFDLSSRLSVFRRRPDSPISCINLPSPGPYPGHDHDEYVDEGVKKSINTVACCRIWNL